MNRLAIGLGLVAGLWAGSAAIAHDGLPIGDGKIAREPRVGHVFVCETRFGGGGAQRVGPWVREGFWFAGEKIAVRGNVPWPNARFSIAVEGRDRVIRANNLPNHASGQFPVRADDPAYAYDRNPNTIREQGIVWRLPAQPVPAAHPTCVPMGQIGIALSGVAIYNALDGLGRDAPAYEIQDACGGHPERSGQYHYHDLSPCLDDREGKAGRHSALLGYALDGFGIFGPVGDDGKEVGNAALDACHGHVHEVPWDGRRVTIYHYHFTREYPYTLGCFRGAVDRTLFAGGGGAGGGPPNGQRPPGPPPGGGRPAGPPPR
ncbi:MAG: YHYH protein [Alphaproteobacteria bacterium]|nr:YHYH protein [Alphaproteobacteria bacterium]